MAQRMIRLEDDMYEATAHIAKLEHRSHANQVNYILTLAIGFYDELQKMDRAEKQMVKDHIVKEGRDLGILPPEKIGSEANASGVFSADDVKHVPDVTVLEKPCCANDMQPCSHWVWDVNRGEGYINSLSGRYREAV